ncbi:hypothetical protein PF008_g16418 [Phytophthora fragariae]|uniref:Uncharacterized protein n=1 Tax=Phytophthora fragariae TaxID=53985 RepID=A0A6G0RBD9_9STRA|nr:hypothetical protein PF008_g16418 [Phytophthora fragariae]
MTSVYFSQGIQAAGDTLRQFEEANTMRFGSVARSHLSATLPRQPDMTTFTMPDDNTTGQAKALDAAIAESEAPHTEATGTSRRTSSIRLRVNGFWVGYEVEVLDLRAALGLPAYDIFIEGMFHRYEPVQPPQDDVPDVDHQQEDED